MVSISSYLHEIRDIAEEAGRAIMKIYDSGVFKTVIKDDFSPLTAADKAAHDLIQSRLERLPSQYPVLSEESRTVPYEKRKDWPRYWLVDPLDGTKEFLKRNGEFTVNIALIEKGEPVLGILHAPAMGVTYTAAKGIGAFKWKDGQEKRIWAADYRKGNLCIVASRSHAGPKIQALIEELKPERVLSMGSALKIGLVAEGEAHFYPRLAPTMEWDTAAAHCIVNEAGGSLIDLEGNELRYNREELRNPFFLVCGNPPFPWQKYNRYFH